MFKWWKKEKYKKGDFIEFQKEPFLEEKMPIMVDDILHYDNFNELLNNISIEFLADSSLTKKQVNTDLEKFYPIEKQKNMVLLLLS